MKSFVNVSVKEMLKATGRFGLLAVMFLLSVQISAADIAYPCQKLIEKGEFDKAYESLHKMFMKSTNECEICYSYSMYYLSRQNPSYSITNAYERMKCAEENFQKADEKTLKKLQKRGYSADLFKEEFRKIRQMALQDIETKKTAKACGEFLKVFPNDEEVSRVKSLEYDYAFAEAQKANTVAEYSSFVRGYPEAPQVAQAQSALYELDYAEAQKKGTEAAYREYIKNYPESPRLAEAQQAAEKARKKEEQAAFQKALSEAERSGRCGSDLTWTYKNSVLTIWGNGEIPNYGTNYRAPWGGSEVTSVVVKPGVTHIGSEAFYKCEKCKTITIPNTVTSVGSEFVYPYRGCVNIHYTGNVQEWMGVASKIVKAMKGQCGYNLYVDGELVNEITIPGGVTTIPTDAFADCSSLTSIVLPNSVTSIGDGAFRGCENLRMIFLGQSLQSIGDEAFRYCKKLESITFPNTLQRIGSRAFGGCELISSVKIPASLYSIGIGAFYGCKSLPVVDNMRYAGTFCIGVTDNSKAIYTVKEGTRWIDGGAFYGCQNLNSVTIPASVQCIGEDVFKGCKNLATIYFNGDLAQWCNMYRGATDVGDYAYDLYIDGELLKDFVVPEGVTKIPACAFRKVRNLQTITLPNSVTSIEKQAFKDCENLTTINFGENLQTIGYEAFRNCEKMGDLVIPHSVTEIGEWAFVACKGMKKLTLTNPELKMGREAFYEVDGLLELYYPKEWENKKYWGLYVSQTYDVIVKLIPLK